ncbi:MAG: hypothetical protein IKE23_00135 [Exiguobacterium sp.]|nr:hypothetical protein [Exiguobacterium sp.]
MKSLAVKSKVSPDAFLPMLQWSKTGRVQLCRTVFHQRCHGCTGRPERLPVKHAEPLRC